MTDISLGNIHAQQHKFAHRLTPNVRLVKELSYSYHHQIEQRIDHELAQNPALEIDYESSTLEQSEPEEKEDDHNEDFDKPLDEYETGDALSFQDDEPIDYFDVAGSLEQSAIQRFIDNSDQLEHALQCIDDYRIYGYFQEDTDPQLQVDLSVLEKSTIYHNAPSGYPTFEVVVDGDSVEANVVPIGSKLKYIPGLGPFSTSAKHFLKALHDRDRVLSDLAYYVLEILQGDFFRQNELDHALRYLLPVTADELNLLYKDSPFDIDVDYLSKLGDQLVSCRFGTLPLNFFLPNKSQLVRLWVNFAKNENRVTPQEQLYWIWNQIENRVKAWGLNDIRHKFILPLKNITIDGIKYARKSFKQKKQKLKR